MCKAFPINFDLNVRLTPPTPHPSPRQPPHTPLPNNTRSLTRTPSLNLPHHHPSFSPSLYHCSTLPTTVPSTSCYPCFSFSTTLPPTTSAPYFTLYTYFLSSLTPLLSLHSCYSTLFCVLPSSPPLLTSTPVTTYTTISNTPLRTPSRNSPTPSPSSPFISFPFQTASLFPPSTSHFYTLPVVRLSHEFTCSCIP